MLTRRQAVGDPIHTPSNTTARVEITTMIRKKILVVEDNEDNRRILVFRLRKIGDFEIREATQGEQALALIAEEVPDLMFLDLKLPILDGWETARRIRAMPGRDFPGDLAVVARRIEAGDPANAGPTVTERVPELLFSDPDRTDDS